MVLKTTLYNRIKSPIKLGPDLIYEPKPFSSTASSSKNTTSGISLIRHKKNNNPIVTSVFQDLLQISPDIFEEFVLDDLIAKKPVPAKKKGVSKRINTTRLIQSGLGMVEKEKGEEILDVRIRSRSRIICNTRKMLLYKLILAQDNL